MLHIAGIEAESSKAADLGNCKTKALTGVMPLVSLHTPPPRSLSLSHLVEIQPLEDREVDVPIVWQVGKSACFPLSQRPKTVLVVLIVTDLVYDLHLPVTLLDVLLTGFRHVAASQGVEDLAAGALDASFLKQPGHIGGCAFARVLEPHQFCEQELIALLLRPLYETNFI